MVGSSSSKILTVSYGTFSCTLEGFDDPFSTMRHIAEYFRDLAADDRYFGAEPPTPDAEMLHRIAEREIQRRVESHVSGEGVVLRQLDSGLAEDEADLPAAEMIDKPAAATDEAGAEPMVGTGQDDTFVAAEPEPAEEPSHEMAETQAAEETIEEDVEAAHDPRAGSIEEKLSRIRAVVERTRSRDIGAGLAATATEESDADDEAMVADMSPGFAGDIDATLISQVMAEQAAGENDRVPDEDGPVAAEPIWDFDEDVEIVAHPDDDAADAQTVATDDAGWDEEEDAPAGADEETFDDEADLGEPAAEAAPVEEPAPSPEPVAETEAAEADEPRPPVDADIDDTEAPTANEDTDAAIARIMAGDDPAEAAATSAEEGETPPLQPDEPKVEVASEPTLVRDAPAVAEDETAEDETGETETAEVASAGVTGEAEDDLWGIDFDAEARNDADRDDGEEEGRALDMEGDEASEWHADAEADAAPKDAPTLAEARGERSLSKSSQLRAPDEESDRLQHRTDSAFAENEGSRRRSAIAHLKAAVAATRADKILSRVVGRDRAGDPEEQKDYREDLQDIVKPRRTSETVETSVENDEPRDEAADVTLEIDGERDIDETPARPDSSRVKTRLLGPEDTIDVVALEDDEGEGEDRPSPLMLVSELRVEGAEDDPAIRPRRVSRDLTAEENAAAAEESKGFADFAQRMGAHDLTDLLEAAAAYTAFIEGQPHFSRPQIMRRVAKVDPTIEQSREAGLRSFGQLLRQGRIQKLQRGQFTVSETTRFKPEQRYAGE
ncbi:MAG: hypothetical protein QNJ13_11310 [Paracoccaceae bacterium]|nr:hypothetical protein [Paracoccaceae bacterium]